MDASVFAAKCRKCGKLSYPTHFRCPSCGAIEFDEIPIEGEGSILTYTRAYALSLDYEQLYLTLGIAELDMGIRATGQVDVDDVRTGMRIRVEVGPVRDLDGLEVNGLVFKRA